MFFLPYAVIKFDESLDITCISITITILINSSVTELGSKKIALWITIDDTNVICVRFIFSSHQILFDRPSYASKISPQGSYKDYVNSLYHNPDAFLFFLAHGRVFALACFVQLIFLFFSYLVKNPGLLSATVSLDTKLTYQVSVP